ncbi:hypothetical protein [Exiguobacterium oxidotolerans]|uniref:Permease n=1 Tax=Exiguobacterium oxidotolerans TaxID=223958 RepID=A0A653IEM9_9BACL|nr:hypothetical protein [Exiguobacterium oxidotolerans]VWX37691.1 conserved membrane hypothetical protein [Exiguobacterium oxidotolerans]
MDVLVSALFIAAGLGLQYLLSSKNNPYLGVIIPVLFVTGMTWRYLEGGYNSFLAYILILGFGLILLFEEWSRGRKAMKKNQEKELEKIRTYDIN